MHARTIVVLLAAALASCGGGGAIVQPPVATSAQSNPSAGAGATIDTTILVPGSSATQSDRRGAQYVSASTLGLKITITDIPPTGGTASFAPVTSIYALAVGSNNIVVPLPASQTGHTEDLTYVTYNTAPVAGAIPAAAKALGWALKTGVLILPGPNSISVVLSGVVDGFPAPLAESGAFGMMGAIASTLAGAQIALGFGGASPASGNATLNDASLNNINTSAGNPWPVVNSVPAAATTAATGVPLTIVETAGSCGAVGGAPHLQLSYNGSTTLATTATLLQTTDTIQANYDGNGGAGWYAVISAKGQTQTLTYTLSSLAATSPSADFNCKNQTLSFSSANETALMTIAEHVPAQPYMLTVPTACSTIANVYIGNSTLPANQIAATATPTSLGAAVNTFTIQLVANPPTTSINVPCVIEIQDANVGLIGGATFPGATTYVTAILPAANYQQITVP